MFRLLNKYYIFELLTVAIILFLSSSFIHTSFDITQWHIFTRLIDAIIFICIFGLSMYVAETESGK